MSTKIFFVRHNNNTSKWALQVTTDDDSEISGERTTIDVKKQPVDDADFAVGTPPLNPILVGVAQAKISGIVFMSTLLSQSIYVQNGGDPWLINAILSFPPGGPIVWATCAISGIYTLWRIQPVLQAVQLGAKAADEKRRLREEEARRENSDNENS
eukprot:CAMPEP_0171320322 /NCGR_PEP_ID=MMETSP0816-20121228/103444_1 /TAXON_ID=420281 /ORGANISM="Proboscia inermis, Strain CCAP1064/1" /LENGTH=155 /DNA_ID=CAMNT_0011817029 /DNA_START=131 /DNA_END=599 /DNA_ORIENTATION=+